MDVAPSPVLRSRATDAPSPMRLDAGGILKRLFFLEDALVRSCAGWIASAHAIETKALLARIAWEASLTGDALRERVFEIRYPSRLMEIGDDASLVRLFHGASSAPSSVAFLEGLASVFLPAQLDAYRTYLETTDALADGPSARFLSTSIDEKQSAIDALAAAVPEERASAMAPSNADAQWLDVIRGALGDLDGGARLAAAHPVSVAVQLDAPETRTAPRDPARDSRYAPCRFYWPDILDPGYDYGSGLRLQLRSAVSHLNEVWAVEVAGAALSALSDSLGWEFTRDAARWTYDESRHMLMGQRRLEAWGVSRELLPLGRYIYDASISGEDPVYLIGMLGFFETKNIGKKQTRASTFEEMGDALSQRDMQFDWADETIHAEYGRRWLKRLLELRGRDGDEYALVLDECEALLRRQVETALPGELDAIRSFAERLVTEAERLASPA